MEMDPIHVLVSGGPVMIALGLVSLLLYKSTIGLFVFVRRVRFEELNEDRMAVHNLAYGASESDSPLAATKRQIEVVQETFWQFKQIVQSRMRYAHALLVAAPLLGLLGTVMGMLDTFRGLSLQTGQETARTVADGISRALITTETGLIIAIPALFFVHWIRREYNKHELRVLERRMQLISKLEG